MRKYGILAFPAKHSLSPEMHNSGFEELGIDAKYDFYEVAEKDFEAFMNGLKKADSEISGLSVSLPYKERIIEFLDEIDEHAEKIGAVNTVIRKDGKLIGTNTDFIGSNKALKEVIGNLKGKKVVIIGAGGASRGVIYGLLSEGANVEIYNRSLEKAENLAKEFSDKFHVEVKYGDLDDMKKIENRDILVQSSSIWTLERDLGKMEIDDFIPMEFVDKFDVVMDIVYKPLITPLLERTRNLGKKIVTGEKMLLYQAGAQFELWTGVEAPIEKMEFALVSKLRD